MTIDWNGLLADPSALAVVEGMIAKNIETITPVVTNDGRIVYAEVNEIVGEGSERVLDALTKAGVLEKSSEARLLGCPVHENALDLMPRLRCSSCGSMLMKKGALYQHLCGNVSPGESYGAGCPKCGKPSPEQSLKLMGVWYECQDCKNKSATPNVYLYCRRFNHDFPVAQAKLVDQASFKLTREAAADLKQRIAPMTGILAGLRAASVQAKLGGKLLGASGVEHSFDLVIENEGKVIPVDIKVSEAGDVQVVAVLSTYAKALDVRTELVALVAMPAASADSRRTAASYGMILVEGSSKDSVVRDLLSSLRTGGAGSSGAKAAYLKA